jgi:hypothetical protein
LLACGHWRLVFDRLLVLMICPLLLLMMCSLLMNLLL